MCVPNSKRSQFPLYGPFALLLDVAHSLAIYSPWGLTGGFLTHLGYSFEYRSFSPFFSVLAPGSFLASNIESTVKQQQTRTIDLYGSGVSPS